MQLLRKGNYKVNNDDSIDDNIEISKIKRVIKSCRGLPLAISVISCLDIQSNNGWENIITAISKKDFDSQEFVHNYKFNIFGTFDLSLNQLNQGDQNLFRSLGVFNAVDIPVESIISLWKLWDIGEYNATLKLKKLHRRSLLNFVNVDRLVLHLPIILYILDMVYEYIKPS